MLGIRSRSLPCWPSRWTMPGAGALGRLRALDSIRTQKWPSAPAPPALQRCRPSTSAALLWSRQRVRPSVHGRLLHPVTWQRLGALQLVALVDAINLTHRKISPDQVSVSTLHEETAYKAEMPQPTAHSPGCQEHETTLISNSPHSPSATHHGALNFSQSAQSKKIQATAGL